MQAEELIRSMLENDVEIPGEEIVQTAAKKQISRRTVNEAKKLVTGINCLPESAYREFMNTKLQYGRLCLQYGLSVVTSKEQSQKVKEMSSREYRAAERGESWKTQLIVTIEDAMAIARSREHFIRLYRGRGLRGEVDS